MPKVFYASRSRSETPPSGFESEDSGSEASTDIEVSRRRPAHRRGESVDVSQPDPKRPRIRTTRDAQGRRALQKACQRNDLDQVRAALTQHVNIEDRDYAGTTALHDAALNGNQQIVEVLLEAGAVVDVRSGLEELDTPLMDAVAAGSVAVTSLLLKHGADPRISNAVGKTAVDFLDEDDESAAEIKRLLDASTRALRASGASVIDGPSHPKALPSLFPPGFEAKKRALSTNFIDVTRHSGRGLGSDAVTHAAQGNLAFVGTALERGWAPTAEALVKAAKFGHQEVAGLLLAFGLGADATYEGSTALRVAVLRGHVSTAQLLLQSGADLAWKDSHGRSYTDMVADLPASDPMRKLIEGKPLTPPAADGTQPAAPGQRKSTKEDEAAQASKHQSRASSSKNRFATDKAAADRHRDSLAALRSSRSVSADRRTLVDTKKPLARESHFAERRSVSDSVSRASPRDRAPSDLPARDSAAAAVTATTSSSSSSSSKPEFRPETFNLADLRAIKPKKRSRPSVETEQVKEEQATVGEADASAKGAKTPTRVDLPAVSPAVPFRGPNYGGGDSPVQGASGAALASVRSTDAVAQESAGQSPTDIAGGATPVRASVSPRTLPSSSTSHGGAERVSSSPREPQRDSHKGSQGSTPALESSAASPATDAATLKAKPPVEASPRWVDRSNELAELLKRKEKERQAREARMLESLAHEERRRSREPESPADVALDSAPSPAGLPNPSREPTPEVADSAIPSAGAPEASAASAAPVQDLASVKHLPHFLRNLAYTGERQDVGPLYVHNIGDLSYYLDVQVAALAALPNLHTRHPSLPRIRVTDHDKSTLWSFCRPWAAGPAASGPAVAAEETLFASLSLTWVPKDAVDQQVFGGNPPVSVHIRLSPVRTEPKWANVLSNSELPLKLQFRALRLSRLPEW